MSRSRTILLHIAAIAITGCHATRVANTAVVGGLRIAPSSVADSMHFEIGPRAALALAGRAYAYDSEANYVTTPELGGSVALLGELVMLDASYMRAFKTDPIDIGQGIACFEALIAFCMD